MMQDDTLGSIEPFEVLVAERLLDDTLKTMLASEEKTTRTYLECRLSELRVRKGRMERAVTKMHVLMVDGLMKDVDDIKNRVKYDNQTGDFRQYILEQCARFECDLQESKHQLLAKLQENSNEIKEWKVANQNVKTTDPHEETADPLEANVDPHNANADPCNSNDDPRDTNVDPHDANADPCKANDDSYEANIDPHDANGDPCNDNPHEANADTRKANDNIRMASAGTHEANTYPHEANVNQHEANAEQHQTNAERHEIKAEQLQASAEQHEAKAEQHKTSNYQHEATTEPYEPTAELREENAERHMVYAELHKANDERSMANADSQEAINELRAKAQRHIANAKLHEAIAERRMANAELHEANAERCMANAELHKVKAERHKTNAVPHEAINEIHEAIDKLHEAIADLRKVNNERHKTNSDIDEAIAVVHETIVELHEEIVELHKAMAERHEPKAELHNDTGERHKINTDPHVSNADWQVTNTDPPVSNADLHEANGNPNEANASLHEANASLNEANASLHEANASLNEANANPNEANASLHEANASLNEANGNPSEANASLHEAQAATQDTNAAFTRDHEINNRPCQVCGMIPVNSQEAGERVQELHTTSGASKSHAIGNNQELQPSNGEQPEPAPRDASKASQELAVSIGVDRNQSQEASNIQVTEEEPTRTQSVNHEVDATGNQATTNTEVASRIEATNYTQQEDSCITNSHQTSKRTLDSTTCKGSTTEGIEISNSRPEGKEYANATTADDGYFHRDDKDLPATADRSSIDLLLIGNCGNGKSATGNSILGKPAFRRNASSSVESESSAPTIMMGSTHVAGKVVNVIDGPSLNVFGNITPEELEKTIKNIHQSLELCEFAFTAVLIALKFGNRFTKQEVDAIRVIKNVLGKDVIRDYGVCVITFGDAFDYHVEEAREDGEEVTFESWLHSQSGEVAKLFEECGYRCVLFDNVTKDANKKLEQVNKLLGVLPQGKRFSQEAFLQAWEGTHGLELEANLPVFLIEAQKEADIIAEMIRYAQETKRLDSEAHKIKSKLSELKEKVYAVRTKSSELERLQLFVLQLETELNMKINQRRMERDIYLHTGAQYAKSETAMLANQARKDVGNASYESHVGGFNKDMSETAVFGGSRSKNHSGFPKDSHAFSSSSPIHGERETTPWYEDTHHDSSVDTFGFVMVQKEKVPGASHESRYDVIKRRVLGFFKGIGNSLAASESTYQSGGHAYVFPPRQF